MSAVRRSRPRCLYCGRAARSEHHVTGKDRRCVYLDAQLTVDLCAPCHAGDHHPWRLLEIDHIDAPDLARLCRLAFFFERIGHLEEAVIVPPSMWREFAACLIALREALERRWE